MRSFILAVFILSFLNYTDAQELVLPGATGYAVPAEKNSEQVFSEKDGSLQWSDPAQKISYFFFARKKGELSLALNAKNSVAGSKLRVKLAGKLFTVDIPAADSFRTIQVGKVALPDSGFYSIELEAVKKAGARIASIASLKLAGEAAGDLSANLKTRRNAASVHMRYHVLDTFKTIAFYNEITVPAGSDPVHSFYMATGFTRGYFGMQVNSATERRIIFSVWDAGKEPADRKKVADSNKVSLIGKGEDVVTESFGNEGTGGHSHWVYNWKAGETYKFVVTALPDSATTSTIYSAYFYVPEVQKWKLIAAFRAPQDGRYLLNPYSFVENFSGSDGQLQRKAFFSNQWIQGSNGNWQELTKASFSSDATGRAKDRIDIGGGTTADGKYFLWNGGFQKGEGRYGNVFNRLEQKQKPAIDWTKNADSAKQATRDKKMIADSVAAKKLDTTGSVEGVYYHILQAGTGEAVEVTDTVTVNYRGFVLNDGVEFDRTKDKPATFPLKRLIRGWQLAIPKSKVGGKIRVIIPSAQAYGMRTRSSKIPPNSVLVFDIEVLAAKKAKLP
ncbi:DUF3472 domain-containing protein [Sediminibacterium ginsengisoli]|uniref:peptidylprolyl isomerase n=1 Tax=Sediminibacterium ginsengisoli TaxID=413434 RepID=A0A1T4L1N1_9BACT|nr:DUF3472 domain-containing protein [Sediminibacterium ginsengisoli]SJZ48498.1 FKBP-type peptidyl-prolyl cis-trans isomerase [Sediminibacterium ginsengisoli]